MLQKDFNPTLRFMVVSDIHYKDDECIEEKRMKRGIELAYEIAESSETYKKLDAIYVVGDFANSGTETQMRKIKKTLDDNIKPETQYCLTLASHEFNRDNGGEEAALKRFTEIFNLPHDDHRVINGFHFISLTTTNGCDFNDAKREYAKRELKKAREDAPTKPIFFFQHPHITDTVSGSIYWGDESLYPILMNYPQVFDFSGHSHVPINDPRSIFQKHFTALGTGSLSYFELDEFDKYYGTVPPQDNNCAQMLIVEANDKGQVRIYPYDILTENFFPLTWEVDTPCDPDSFKYTDAIRYKNSKAPYFPDDFKAEFSDINTNQFTLTFSQAKPSDEYYVNDYIITVKETATDLIVKRIGLWSEYYFYNMPETLSVTIDDLKPDTKYTVLIKANNFFEASTTYKPLFVETK